ncbi:MAG: S-layer like family, N-terminal region [archaeon]|jgi:hypothetical protein
MFKFKKIASVLTSAVMLTSTIGFAAAASYPQPFVSGGAADGAVVYGSNAAISDVTAAIDVQQKLSSLVTVDSDKSDSAVTGEAVALFTGGTKLYINDTLNTVKTTITKSELPNTLKDESFSGNVDASITQTIKVGNDPRITYEKQPTSSDDPSVVLKLSTNSDLPMFNLTATFSKAVNFSSIDSEGNSFTLFGMPVTVGSATTATTLVLLKSAEKLDLSSDAPAADATVSGKVYTVELVSASDTAATVKVTDSAGKSESKEIDEAASKKVNGITIAVVNADETNLKLSASVIAGTDKLTLKDGDSVLIGENDEVVDGTRVQFGGSTTESAENLTTLTIEYDAPDSDTDAIKAGNSYVDPVFGTVKLDFSSINIPEDSTDRENIIVRNNGDDAAEISFTERRGNTLTTVFAVNGTTFVDLVRDDSSPYYNISIREHDAVHAGDYVVLGNEDTGYLLKLESTANSSTAGTSNDRARFVDVATGETLPDVTWSSEGTGTLLVGGLSYTVTMTGDANNNSEQRNVRINDAKSTTNGVIMFNSIETSKGANVGFYFPQTLNFTDINGDDRFTGVDANISALLIPDGDGYTTVTVATGVDAEYQQWQIGTENLTLNGTAVDSVEFTVGPLIFNATNAALANTIGASQGLQIANQTGLATVFLQQPGGATITGPAVIIWEEKDDNSEYEAMVIPLENGLNADDGMGISDIFDTWSNGSGTWEATLKSDSDIAKSLDLWGSIMSEDNSDSDQKVGIVSYPDEQVYAEIYLAASSAAITPGSTSSGGGGQVLIVKDSEVTSVATKNLFVVGGSCINTVAAKILGSDSPLCAADFTTKTNAGVGQYIIKSVKSPYNDQKVALLVAGYEAADTMNAVKKALEGVTTDSGTEAVYPIASA